MATESSSSKVTIGGTTGGALETRVTAVKKIATSSKFQSTPNLALVAAPVVNDNGEDFEEDEDIFDGNEKQKTEVFPVTLSARAQRALTAREQDGSSAEHDARRDKVPASAGYQNKVVRSTSNLVRRSDNFLPLTEKGKEDAARSLMPPPSSSAVLASMQQAFIAKAEKYKHSTISQLAQQNVAAPPPVMKSTVRRSEGGLSSLSEPRSPQSSRSDSVLSGRVINNSSTESDPLSEDSEKEKGRQGTMRGDPTTGKGRESELGRAFEISRGKVSAPASKGMEGEGGKGGRDSEGARLTKEQDGEVTGRERRDQEVQDIKGSRGGISGVSKRTDIGPGSSANQSSDSGSDAPSNEPAASTVTGSRTVVKIGRCVSPIRPYTPHEGISIPPSSRSSLGQSTGASRRILPADPTVLTSSRRSSNAEPSPSSIGPFRPWTLPLSDPHNPAEVSSPVIGPHGKASPGIHGRVDGNAILEPSDTGPNWVKRAQLVQQQWEMNAELQQHQKRDSSSSSQQLQQPSEGSPTSDQPLGLVQRQQLSNKKINTSERVISDIERHCGELRYSYSPAVDHVPAETDEPDTEIANAAREQWKRASQVKPLSTGILRHKINFSANSVSSPNSLSTSVSPSLRRTSGFASADGIAKALARQDSAGDLNGTMAGNHSGVVENDRSNSAVNFRRLVSYPVLTESAVRSEWDAERRWEFTQLNFY